MIVSSISLFALTPAASSTAYAGDCRNGSSLLPGVKPWYDGLCNSSGEVEISRDDFTKDIWRIVLNCLSIALMLGSYAAVGFVMWGGTKYILAAGDSSKITAGKKTIQNALIGLLISLSAVAIVEFITGQLK